VLLQHDRRDLRQGFWRSLLEILWEIKHHMCDSFGGIDSEERNEKQEADGIMNNIIGTFESARFALAKGAGNGRDDQDPAGKLGAITMHSDIDRVNGAVVTFLSDVMSVLHDQRDSNSNLWL